MRGRNFINLNVNPCNMCMPLGAVTAFKGLENSMMILHGSQGCSTYIRRHMAGHYNEPIDVASTSLSEEGTVYGGEKNLKTGLRNIIKTYRPKVIGVATTCLAETIGEDVRRIVDSFEAEEGSGGVQIIPVGTPGYGGTQFEGYFAALLSIVRQTAADRTPHRRINVIAANLNPGDVRNIKEMLAHFDLDCILLPDVSETLDAPYQKGYARMPAGGTRLSDIRMMAGAAATIEMGLTIPESLSPGRYLADAYQIPLYRCPIPIGIRNTDIFVKLLADLSGKAIPHRLTVDRGRMLDGMIDAHKYNAEGRAVVYGEPEQVLAVSRLCLENGIAPVLASTGSQSGLLRELLSEEKGAEAVSVIEDTDFETIQKYAVELGANILIGSSDGKVITEKEGIPLVRYGFPVHDRIGGQRAVYTGYNGSLALLDAITNTLLGSKYEGYRKRMHAQYFKGTKEEAAMPDIKKKKPLPSTVEEKTASHPCYSSGAGDNARMHIPVAPGCNISCNYCNREYDCQNESRPGVTSEVLSPGAALAKFLHVRERVPNLKVIGIAGPGDALANFENTRKSIALIREADPAITFCLSTNGLMLPRYGKAVLALGVRHITITINAIDPEIAAGIYKEVNYEGKTLTGTAGARVLIANQLSGLRYLAEQGAVVKVNIVMIPGINDGHIEAVVKKVKALGAYMTNIMPLIPARGSLFENMPQTNNKDLNALRKTCESDLKQMYHCKQCRADAIGLLSQDRSSEFSGKSCGGCSPGPIAEGVPSGEESYLFAVATESGTLVDRHFGQVDAFSLYRYEDGDIRFLEKRNTARYCAGPEECDSEETRLGRTIDAVSDCDAVLVMRIGHTPLKTLSGKGVRVVQTCGGIQEAILREAAILQNGSDDDGRDSMAG